MLKSPIRDFPGGPVVKTLPSNAGGADLIPIQWAKDPTCLAAKKKKQKTKTKTKKHKQKQYCNKFSNDLGGKKERIPLDSVQFPCRWLRHFLQPLCLFPPVDFGCLTGHWFVEKDRALLASQVVPMLKNLPVNAGDTDSIPGLGISPGEGNGNSLQYSCLENPMHRGARQVIVLGRKESNMTEQLS